MRKLNTRNFRLATRSTPREVNRQIVLNLIREHQPISRAELARRMKVPRAALTSIVRDLLERGAVYEAGAAAAVRGRRPRLLAIRTSGQLVIAADVRQDRTSLALSDVGGRIVARKSFRTPESPERLLDDMVTHVSRVLREHRAADGETVQGVGIVVPGMVDRHSGRVLYAPRLGWRDVDLQEPLAARLGLAVSIESAPIACALARLWSLTGDSRAVNNFAYVSVSDGVGVAVVVRGEVLRGEAHTAGEIGHVSLDPNGPRCACGKRGCWEAFCCNAATVARYADALGGKRGTRSAIAVEEIVRRALRGEPAAAHAIAETGGQIGRGLAAVVSAFNPKRIYIGGEITAAWELIEPPMRAVLAENTLTEATRSTPIHPDPDPAEYRLLGAVALVSSPAFALPRVG
ncbi:MAG TPA: ROK family transcriptional regulator [Gemmatimonadaceae bacterium]|nr:ROK family transcriptional regulator [Gemmatimonadaceae bacterium]